MSREQLLLLEAGTPRHAASFSRAYPNKGRLLLPRARGGTAPGLAAGAALLLLLLAAAGFAALALRRSGLRRHRSAAAAEPATRYVLVLDSGSSGTRIYAFNWTSSAAPGLPLVAPIPPSAAPHLIPKRTSKGMYSRVETLPGLDAFLANPAGLEAAALGPLLAWARGVVPARQRAASPLFLLATGGVRRLDAASRESLLADARRVLAGSGFRFEPSWAKTISGSDEGMYGWLALNYEAARRQAQQQQQQQQQQPTRHAGSSAVPVLFMAASSSSGGTGSSTGPSTGGSVGALDLGGSSLELTFEVPAPGPLVGARPASLSVGGSVFHLHTHTYHHYGLNEAYDRAVTLLLQRHQEEQQQQAQLQQTAQQQPQQAQPQPAQQPPAQLQQQQAVQQQPRSGALDMQRSDGATSPSLAQQQQQAELAMAAAAGLTARSSSAPVGGGQSGAGASRDGGGSRSSSDSGSSSRVPETLELNLRGSGLPAGLRAPGSAVTATSSNVASSSPGTQAAAAVVQQQHGLERGGSSSSGRGARRARLLRQQRRQQRHLLLLQHGHVDGLLHHVPLLGPGVQPRPAASGEPGRRQSPSRHRLLARPLPLPAPDAPSALPVPDSSSSLAANSSSISLPVQQQQELVGSVLPGAQQLPVVRHPCLHDGFSASYERTAFDGRNPDPPQVLLQGAPDWQACLVLMDRVVNATAPCQQLAPERPLCRLGAAQPELRGQFLAITGFYVVARFLQLPDGAPLDAVLDASRTLCGRPWSWVHAQLGQHINVERYCSWGPYTVKLLRQGLGLQDSDVRLGSADAGWPLGAALVEASKLEGFGGAAAAGAQAAAAQSKQQQQPTGAARRAWRYSQHRSWAQALLGRRGSRLHSGLVLALLLAVLAWLAAVVLRLPSRRPVAAGGGGAMWAPAFAIPGKAQHTLPVVAPSSAARGRSPISSKAKLVSR